MCVLLRLRVALAGGLLVAGMSSGAPAVAAPPETVTCGEVITHSVTLAADVSCPAFQSPGLVVGADGITIDLNGHQIAGVPLVGGGSAVGVVNNGHSGVAIRNGTVADFGTMIQLTGASDNRLAKLTVFGGNRGIAIQGGRANTVRADDVNGRSVAVGVTGSDQTRVVGNTVFSSFGASIDVESNAGVIAHNTAATGGSVGVLVGGSSNRIAGNIVGNEAVDVEIGFGSGNVVAGNWVVNAFMDGVIVSAQATNTAVRRNVAVGNRGDGIHVESASTRIVDNTANGNANFGIEAVPGVFALGNHASGNGNALQCLNVACTP